MSIEGTPLSSIASVLGVSPPERDAVITDVHHDSRAVGPGSLFVAVVGSIADGHDFVPAAVAGGASGLIVERPLATDAPQIVVPDSRAALAVAAALVHGEPSRRLRVVGVTGTNGKTTVTHMIESIGRSAGLATGLVGTLGARIGEAAVPLERTTPESSDLQRLFARMAATGTDLVAMEVSSHALALHRADAIHFRVAAFTNLSQDHLDFHGDMEAYYAEKARLFDPERAGVAVLWIDDAWARRLAGEIRLPVVRVSAAERADVHAEQIEVDARGSSVALRAGDREARIRLPLPARFNVHNALIAAAVCLEMGIGFEDTCRGLETLPPVPGRFEVVPGPWPFQAIVDYAHTPEAVAAAIGEARALAEHRVLAVVGAGGDRDQQKRPMMGAAASTADVTIVTSDNPRSEDPAAIAAEVAGGIADDSGVIVEIDRRTAIRMALAAASEGDIVLVLGKGHEQGQEFSDGLVEPFDDRVVVGEEGVAITQGAST